MSFYDIFVQAEKLTYVRRTFGKIFHQTLIAIKSNKTFQRHGHNLDLSFLVFENCPFGVCTKISIEKSFVN